MKGVGVSSICGRAVRVLLGVAVRVVVPPGVMVCVGALVWVAVAVLVDVGVVVLVGVGVLDGAAVCNNANWYSLWTLSPHQISLLPGETREHKTPIEGTGRLGSRQ